MSECWPALVPIFLHSDERVNSSRAKNGQDRVRQTPSVPYKSVSYERSEGLPEGREGGGRGVLISCIAVVALAGGRGGGGTHLLLVQVIA